MEDYIRYQYNRDYTPDAHDRPHREDPITQDDVLNLIIALELNQDVSNFLEDHHIFQ